MTELIADLRRRFGERFLCDSNQRLALARAGLDRDGDLHVARRELHSLAGEAALLGHVDIYATAANALELIGRWSVTHDQVTRDGCASALRRIQTLLDRESAAGAAAAPADDTEPLDDRSSRDGTPDPETGDDPDGC